MLAELIDAVVGVDTHRDTHEVEIALPTGVAIGARTIRDDSSGLAELLAWILEPCAGTAGGRVDRGSRGVGLARAVYIARELYRTLNASTTLTGQTSATPEAA
jgi:hypothetical protein